MFEDRRAQKYQEAKELCDQAKKLSLCDWFASETGRDVKYTNGRHRCTWCPRCGESASGNFRVFIIDDATWGCWLCDPKGTTSGSILDAEMICRGGTLSDAARRLLGYESGISRPVTVRHVVAPEVKRAREQEEREKHEAVSRVVQIVCKHTKELRDDRVIQYLTGTGRGQRGLPLDVVEQAIERNLLRTLPSSPAVASAMIRAMVPEDLLRKAKLWKDDAKAPWIVYRPLWFIAPGATGAELRIAHEPRENEPKSLSIGAKELPYYWQGAKPAGCGVVEGFIDLMALVALGYEGDVLAMPGANCWEIDWFVKMSQSRGTQRFDTFFDNDDHSAKNPGQTAAAELGSELVARGLRWKNTVPPSGDVNDFWLSKLKST